MKVPPTETGTIVTFALAGLFAGSIFDWLTRQPGLKEVFFLRCKLCGPTLNYWVVYDLLFLFALVFAFVIIRTSAMVIRVPGVARLLLSSAVGGLDLVLYTMTPELSFFGMVVAPFLLMLILIAALHILFARWDNLAASLIFLSPLIMLGLGAFISSLNTSSDLARTLIDVLDEMLLFSFVGLWLTRTSRAKKSSVLVSN
jgi:hypothetical protein